MAKRRGTKAVKRSKRAKDLAAKSVTARQGKSVAGGGATVLTNLQQLKHETLKGIAGNLRG